MSLYYINILEQNQLILEITFTSSIDIRYFKTYLKVAIPKFS